MNFLFTLKLYFPPLQTARNINFQFELVGCLFADSEIINFFILDNTKETKPINVTAILTKVQLTSLSHKVRISTKKLVVYFSRVDLTASKYFSFIFSGFTQTRSYQHFTTKWKDANTFFQKKMKKSPVFSYVHL